MADYPYLSYLILFVLLLYFIILSSFLIIRRYEIKSRLKDRPPSFMNQIAFDDSSFTFDWTTKVEEIADSIYGRHLRYLLLGFRCCACLFFFVYGIVMNLEEGNVTLFNYFDGWNYILLTFYFFCSSVVTFTLIRYGSSTSLSSASFPQQDNDDTDTFAVNTMPEWSYQIRFVAVAAHMLFEIIGANSLFLLFGQFVINISSNISTLPLLNILSMVTLLVDLSVNNIKIRFDQYPATAAWLMFYLLVIWPSVFTGAITDWPYNVLDTTTKVCFGNYLALYFANFCCFVTWYVIYKLKKRMVLYILYGRNGLHRDYDEERTPRSYEMRDLRQLSSLDHHNNQNHSLQEGDRHTGDTTDQVSISESFYSLEGDNNNNNNNSQQNRQLLSSTQQHQQNSSHLSSPHSNTIDSSASTQQRYYSQPHQRGNPLAQASSGIAGGYNSHNSSEYSASSPYDRQSGRPPVSRPSNYGQMLMSNLYDADSLSALQNRRLNIRQSSANQFSDTDADIINYGGFSEVADP